MMEYKVSIGSISHGTLRAEDLAERFHYTLTRLEHGDSELLSDLEAIFQDQHLEYESEVISDAIDALQEYAPEFCYFGAHDGNGSDFGFWPDHDAIQEAIYDGDAISITDLADLDELSIEETNASHAILVNDHGNMTVYKLHIAATSIWDCV